MVTKLITMVVRCDTDLEFTDAPASLNASAEAIESIERYDDERRLVVVLKPQTGEI